MSAKQPLRGPGYFQWNAGGWFGMLIGGSAWLIAGSLLLGVVNPDLGWTWAFCGAACLALSIGLWWRRDRIEPYPALQILLLGFGAAGLLAILATQLCGQLNLLLPWVQPPPNPIEEMYLALLVFPGLMVSFHLKERAARRQGGKETRSARE